MEPTKRDKICRVVNRFGGIIIWVGVWNILCIIVNENDVTGNIILSVLGLCIWVATGEFDELKTYEQLPPDETQEMVLNTTRNQTVQAQSTCRSDNV